MKDSKKTIKGLSSYLFGQASEDVACKYLKQQAFKILYRNYRFKFSEIDIIASKDKVLHFVEVKASKKYQSHLRLNNVKLSRLEKAIEVFLLQHDEFVDYSISFDCICIDDGKIDFFENIYL